MGEQWGPWIEHDGKGCPVYGMSVEAQIYGEENRHSNRIGRKTDFQTLDSSSKVSAWVWFFDAPTHGKVTRYRIRKPRGLTMLEGLIADLPQPAEAETT